MTTVPLHQRSTEDLLALEANYLKTWNDPQTQAAFSLAKQTTGASAEGLLMNALFEIRKILEERNAYPK